MRRPWARIRELLAFLYGREAASPLLERLQSVLQRWAGCLRPPVGVDPRECLHHRLRFDQGDCLLIAYGDQFRERGVSPLETLERAMTLLFHDLLRGVHVLPFFPYSSDDGFSVLDFRAVDPRLGDWGHIERIAERRLLMLDLVLNHASARGAWFQGYLQGDPRYRDFFIQAPQGADLSAVFRPRTLPLLTEFRTAAGPRRLWTTFGPDQVDLNYACPDVLLEMLDVLLYYASKGAQLVRLDAVAYAWKEAGTPCLHHPKTHGLVRLLRAVLDAAAPWVLLATETNVPQAENLSYFGDGTDEAQLVYQFPLPPLVLDAFLREDASTLRAWAASLPACGPSTAFFNFLASHDGIGLLPAAGLLPPGRIRALADAVLERGGRVSYKSTLDGEVPYELNIGYLDALAHPDEPEGAEAFLAAQAILLALAGVPGLYAHSLLGTPGDREAVERTGQPRAINRRKLEYAEAEALLERESSLGSRVLAGTLRLLAARAVHPAFHPRGAQRVVGAEGALFCLERTSPDGREQVLCLHNTGSRAEMFRPGPARGAWLDLISGQAVLPERDGGGLTVIHVGPYQALWLTERQATEAAGLHPVTQAARPAPAQPAESVAPQDRECPECVRIFRRLSRPLYPVPTGLRSRGRLRLPVQAVLFDLYGTLWVSAAGDPESRNPSGSPAPPGLQELLERYGCPRSPRSLAQELAAAVRREHERLRGQGADFPEARIEEVWAGLHGLEDPARARAFAAEYEALVNPVWPMPGLREVLAGLRRQGLRLGILSNAQFYTPYLFECFLGADARALGFRDELVLYSFEHGLSKPSTRLFAIARGRLAAAGIRPGRVLLVGNDAHMDLAPAREAGFQTVLFAGDARSLRGAEEAGVATAVITALGQLPRLLARSSARFRASASEPFRHSPWWAARNRGRASRGRASMRGLAAALLRRRRISRFSASQISGVWLPTRSRSRTICLESRRASITASTT